MSREFQPFEGRGRRLGDSVQAYQGDHEMGTLIDLQDSGDARDSYVDVVSEAEDQDEGTDLLQPMKGRCEQMRSMSGAWMIEARKKGEPELFMKIAEEVLVKATETLSSLDNIEPMSPLCRAVEKMEVLEGKFSKFGWTARLLNIHEVGQREDVEVRWKASKTEKAADTSDDAKTAGGMDADDGFEWKACDASLDDIIDEAFAQQQGSKTASSGENPNPKRSRKGHKTRDVE